MIYNTFGEKIHADLIGRHQFEANQRFFCSRIQLRNSFESEVFCFEAKVNGIFFY